MQLVFVTQNKNKVADAIKLLPEYEIEHISFEIPEIQSLDCNEIADFKLKYAFERVQKPCFVMDASLNLDCLGSFPGPFIKWYFDATVGAEKTCKIAKHFNEFGCKWTTVLGYYDGLQTHFIEESVFGEVPTEPRGKNGYSWDVIFIPQGDNRTFAEMTFEEKQKFTPTSKIFNRFRDILKQN
jgi:non-canonical purine NTP pyrophosphatase (RdgB/HAM1 family)